MSSAMMSKKRKQVEFTKEYMTKLWEDMTVLYVSQSILVLEDVKKLRHSLISNLNQCQSEFISFLERPTLKQEKVDNFVQSLQKFTLEYPELRKDDQTKEELGRKLEELSN
jgi:hypothetical protein